ncbi:hypothetical protein Lal_00011308 [Lupinus albus]|nr:hypothetical protein Lal_00011308 [Lupinus albus]
MHGFSVMDDGSNMFGTRIEVVSETLKICESLILRLEEIVEETFKVTRSRPQRSPRMYVDNLKEDEVATPKSIFPRNYGPQRNHIQGRGKKRVKDDRKPYAAPIGHRDRNLQGSRPPIVPTGGVSTPMCNKCGRLHYGSTCPGSGNGCFHCKELGNIKRSDTLLVFVECVNRLRLYTESLFSTWLYPPHPGYRWWVSILVSQCMVGVNGRTFTIVLIRLMMSHLDLILAMDWWSANRVMLNYVIIVMVIGVSTSNSWKPRLIQRFSLERERCIWEGEILGYTGGFSPERELYHPGEKWQFWAV